MTNVSVGILERGQLEDETGRAALKLGFPCGFLARPESDPCDTNTGPLERGDFNDEEALKAFAAKHTHIAHTWESIPEKPLRFFEKLRKKGGPKIAPSSDVIAVGSRRLSEQNLFGQKGIPAPPHREARSLADLIRAWDALGGHVVVKTNRGGYDGGGQRVVQTEQEAIAAWDALYKGSEPLMVQRFTALLRELSFGGGRGSRRKDFAYPLTENIHEDGILRLSIAPATDQRHFERAFSYARRIFDEFDYRGFMAIEFFETHHRQLLANEIAPRPHNTYWWTVEGAATSQFEQYVRALTGLPVGSTELRGFSAMVNILYEHELPKEGFPKHPKIHVHVYGKKTAPGRRRKYGHVTVVGDTPEERRELVQLIRPHLPVPEHPDL